MLLFVHYLITGPRAIEHTLNIYSTIHLEQM